jgi:endogenous inhibitor of DNA gyrase (YacG/DUF329 family)
MCVNCREHPVHPAWRPFCSERCKMEDLRRWLTGEYRVPGEPLDQTAEADHEPDAEDQ